MVLVEPRVQGDYGARRMTGVLDLVVVGGAVVLIDVNVGPVPLLPDAVGYVLVAVGGGSTGGHAG